MKVKICGIQNELMSEKVSKLGPDFMGIVFHPQSKRAVKDLNIAKNISRIARENYVQPVSVFVHSSAKEMETQCRQSEINIVQLHGDISRNQHHLLPNDFAKIFVIPVEPSGFFNFNLDEIQQLDPEKDYIMFDHQNMGQGQLFNHAAFSQALNQHLFIYKPFRCFLAGGLTANNIEEIIHKNGLEYFYGLDVSSGVETSKGDKSVTKIKQFLTKGKRL